MGDHHTAWGKCDIISNAGIYNTHIGRVVDKVNVTTAMATHMMNKPRFMND